MAEFESLSFTNYPKFDNCKRCGGCTDCSNGIGLESPPGLRGHSMIMTDAGLIIYGGTSWSVTNFTVQDKLNRAIEIYEDNCKMVIDQINL